jgi:hypothetical protein
VKRGDRYIWRHASAPDVHVYIYITRVARDGSWADIRCCTWLRGWSKRQPLPLPEGVSPYEWSGEDLDADAAAEMRRLS